MGRISVKTNKSIYQRVREEAGMTRKEASEKIGYMSENRLEKVENGKSSIEPAEILDLENCYGRYGMALDYCHEKCAIGRRYLIPAADESLETSVLKVLHLLEQLDRQKQRLIQIAICQNLDEDQEELLMEMTDLLKSLGALGLQIELWKLNRNREREKK